jgi:hypothetical protein
MTADAPIPFPSRAFFQRLADAMAAAPERYRKLGPLDITLVPRIRFADGREAVYALTFAGTRCVAVREVGGVADAVGPHPVVIDGEYDAWKEMVASIQTNGAADLAHTLNSLTLPDWPLQLIPLDPAGGQLDVDRFYRYVESLQEFFNEAAGVATRMAA